MPKLALAQIPASVLQAELQRRAKKALKQLKKLCRQRDKLDCQIAELQTIAGPATKAGATVASKSKPGRKPGRPAKTPKKVVRRKRGVFKETASEFVLDLAKTPRTTAQINAAWTKAGRGGTADMTLSKLVKEGRLHREKLKGAKGSEYTLA